MTTTWTYSSPSFGPPPPVTELTIEQRLTLSKFMTLQVRSQEAQELKDLVISLQTQAFMLGNNMRNLLSHWPMPNGGVDV